MLVNVGLVSAVVGAACSIAYAHPTGAHKTRSALPGDWTQPEDSPVYDLFNNNKRRLVKRQNNGTSTNGTDDFPDVGSPGACFSFLLHGRHPN